MEKGHEMVPAGCVTGKLTTEQTAEPAKETRGYIMTEITTPTGHEDYAVLRAQKAALPSTKTSLAERHTTVPDECEVINIFAQQK